MQVVKWWSKKENKEIMLSVMGIICSISIIILACMHILGIWKAAINIMELLLGVLMLIQTIQKWKKNKVVALFSLCAGIFIFLVVILDLVIR